MNRATGGLVWGQLCMDQTFMLSTSLDQIFLYLPLIYFIVFIVYVKLHYALGKFCHSC